MERRRVMVTWFEGDTWFTVAAEVRAERSLEALNVRQYPADDPLCVLAHAAWQDATGRLFD